MQHIAVLLEVLPMRSMFGCTDWNFFQKKRRRYCTVYEVFGQSINWSLWALAELWYRWKDPGPGELVESYTMLAINPGSHPLNSRMYKPDPKFPANAQGKCSTIPIEQ